LRLPRGESWEEIPEGVLEDCVQLVKANSIQGSFLYYFYFFFASSSPTDTHTHTTGCKLPNVPVIYTPHSNLKKTQGMDVGQVGFKNDKLVKTVKVSKLNAILNRLNKTKEEKQVNLQGTRFLLLARRS
jgi:hypothetical protein